MVFADERSRFLQVVKCTAQLGVLQEYRRLYPHRVDGMEMLSTALWHEQDAHALSALAHSLTTKVQYSIVSW